MEEKNVNEETQKMTYEQLESVARQLSEQNRELYTKLQQMDMMNILLQI